MRLILFLLLLCVLVLIHPSLLFEAWFLNG
jgi:hypothetical protein